MAVASDGAKLAISAIFRTWGPKEWKIAQAQWGLKQKDDEDSDDEIDFPIPVWQADKGFNDGEIMLMWIDEVLLPYLNTLKWYLDGNPALLIVDAASAHWTPEVKARLEKLNIHEACIPKLLTFRFQ